MMVSIVRRFCKITFFRLSAWSWEQAFSVHLPKLVLKFSVDINSFCFDISAIAFCMFPPQSSLILVLLGVGFMLESSYFTLFTLSKTLSLWLVEQAAFSPGILILGSSYLISVGFCNLHHLSCWAVTERTAKWRRSERRPLLSRLHYTILLL